MLKKFIEISGVGKFDNCKPFGDVEMRRSTIIYGENGYGKTTLTSIIRSLATEDCEPIIRRKTIGATSQSIKVRVDSSICTYANGDWKNRIEDLDVAIFDSFFVHENIYSGFDLSPDGGKNLHKFVIGKEGVKIAKMIKKVKEEIASQMKDLKGQERSIATQIGNNNFKEFLKLNFIVDIEQKINCLEKEIEVAKQLSKIKTEKSLNLLSSLKLPFDSEALRLNLKTSLNSISKDYIEKVESHKEKLSVQGITSSTEWITQGFNSIQSNTTCEKNCPLCDQPISEELPLIKAYNQYFSEEYKTLHANLSTYRSQINNYNASKGIIELRKTLDANQKLISFWKDYTDCDLEEFDFSEGDIEESYIKLKETVIAKNDSLLEEFDSVSLDLFIASFNQFNDKIDSYNLSISKINNCISSLKQKDSDFNTLKLQLEQLNLIQKRYTPDIDEACKDYLILEETINRANEQKNSLQEELAKQSSDFLKSYGTSINKYIHLLIPNSSYKLNKISSVYSGTSKEPIVQYELTINGSAINFNNNDTTPSFKYTFSEGDKTALAFAFFLAKLEMEDDNISNKIIVFDDPICSLDKHRRRRTISEIINLTVKAKQVITLSHNENFIYELYERSKSQNSKVLRIAHGGKIEDYLNIEEDMQSDYNKTLKGFHEFIANPQTEKVPAIRGSIRIALEDNLKLKFSRYLNNMYGKPDGSKVGPYTGSSGLGNLIDILEASDCTFKKEKIKIINSLRDLNLLSMNDHHGVADKEHRTEDMTADELVGYVEDTLNLIYEGI